MTQLRHVKTSRSFSLGLSFFKSTHLPLSCNVGASECDTACVNMDSGHLKFFWNEEKSIHSERLNC